MQTWSASVNKNMYEPYDYKRETAIIENATDIGIASRRRRTTKDIITHSFTMFMTETEWDALQAWVDTTLQGGILTFGFPHPKTGVLTEMRFLFSDNMWYSGLINYPDNVLFQVSMQEV